MLKLNIEEYGEACAKCVLAVKLSQHGEMLTLNQIVGTVIRALSEDYDISAMDPGPESDRQLAVRAFGVDL